MQLKNLTPIQNDYYYDKHRFIITSAGRRSRKTLIGQRKVLRHSIRNQEQRYFLGAPTYQQAKDIFWKRLLSNTSLLRKDVDRSSLTVRLFNNAEIVVLGLDRPERIEGQEWHGCQISEIGNIKPEAWAEHIRPALADTGGFAILDGVPEGRNHYYEMALYSCDDVIPKTVPLHGAFHDCKKDDEWAFYTWFSSDVLNPSEIAHAKQQLDARTYRQEYEGSFESYAGVAYYTFGVHNFKDVQRDLKSPISVGMDFNVNPMTASLGTIKGDSYHQWGEIWLENSNTREMKDELLKYVDDPEDIIIFPDSTGKAEKSNATMSDLAILRKAGFTVKAKSSNPFIIDRVNSVNSIMVERGAKTRYLVNPKTCPKTINDWNRVIRLDDGRLDKNQEKQMIGHISAAVGYLVTYNWPVVHTDMTYTERY
jgi:hypothetical protein